MRSVIPNLYFFDFRFRLRKMRSPIKIDGNLNDWNDKYLVPDLMHLRGVSPFARIYLSWDNDNIYFAMNVTGKRSPTDCDNNRPWRKDGIEIWFDFRNEKPMRRYTDCCHHFFFLPKGRRNNPELATAIEWKEPGSAIQDNIFDHKSIEIASSIGRVEYSLEARISKESIPTYDPLNYPVIGFNYHINDIDRRSQWWSCGPDFPRHIDPGTWGTIELME